MSNSLFTPKQKPPKILICAPHADRKNYSINDWLSMVKNLTYPKNRYSIFICDNSSTRDNAKWLKKQGINVAYVRPRSKSNIAYMADSHEECRKYAIAGGFDYMLHWETDIQAPPNIIERLLIHKKDVVSAVYPIDFGEDSKLLLQFAEPNVSGHSGTVNADHGDMRFIDGTLKQVFASGLGCILIRKSVLRKFKFRYEPGVQVHPDTIMAYDLQQLGIPIYADTSIILKHNNSEWINF